jgi:3-deoxy-D-manno-octulosonic-acid transferase
VIPLVLLLENLAAPFVALAVLAGFALSRRRRVLSTLSQELGERLGRLPDTALAELRGGPVLWLHAASAGEVAAAAPLIAELSRRPSRPRARSTAGPPSPGCCARRARRRSCSSRPSSGPT